LINWVSDCYGLKSWRKAIKKEGVKAEMYFENEPTEADKRRWPARTQCPSFVWDLCKDDDNAEGDDNVEQIENQVAQSKHRSAKKSATPTLSISTSTTSKRASGKAAVSRSRASSTSSGSGVRRLRG